MVYRWQRYSRRVGARIRKNGMHIAEKENAPSKGVSGIEHCSPASPGRKRSIYVRSSVYRQMVNREPENEPKKRYGGTGSSSSSAGPNCELIVDKHVQTNIAHWQPEVLRYCHWYLTPTPSVLTIDPKIQKESDARELANVMRPIGFPQGAPTHQVSHRPTGHDRLTLPREANHCASLCVRVCGDHRATGRDGRV
ncbi:hypothetical protein BC629DRAFT_938685 [Irpex lacteus]|nr:hypothetical protein BC629DRAFT_938685 [Irpex lacteus]